MIANKMTIDSLFQEKFRDFEVRPNDIMWLEINSKLQVNTQIRVKEFIPLLVSVLGVLTSIVIGFFITNTVIHILENNESLNQEWVNYESRNNLILYKNPKYRSDNSIQVLRSKCVSSLDQESFDGKDLLLFSQEPVSFFEILKRKDISQEIPFFSKKDLVDKLFFSFVNQNQLVNNKDIITKEVNSINIPKQNNSNVQDRIKLKPVVVLSHNIKNTDMIKITDVFDEKINQNKTKFNENNLVANSIDSGNIAISDESKIIDLAINIESAVSKLDKDQLISVSIGLERSLNTIDITKDLDMSSLLKSNLDIPLKSDDINKSEDIELDKLDNENRIILDKTNVDLFLEDQIEKEIKNYINPMASIDFNVDKMGCF